MASPEQFNKERFLLRALAMLFVIQLLFNLLTLGNCLRGERVRPLCADLSGALKDTFEDALATTLALLSANTFNRGNRGPDS
jgi:hypothetical protein